MKHHTNATTTTEMREFIRESDLPTAVLARLLKVSEPTVRKWRKRESVDDKSHVPKHLNTTLSPCQEYVIVELRTRLLLSLDELLEVCQKFINVNASRAGLQRCLKRHGVSRLVDMHDSDLASDTDQSIQVAIEDTIDHKVLLSEVSPEALTEVLNSTTGMNESEVVQVNVTKLPEFQGEQEKRRLLIASDPDSDWVYVDIYDSDEKEAASRYMRHVLTKAPFHIRRILARNYNEFISRFRLLDEAIDNEIDDANSNNEIDTSIRSKTE